MYAIPLIVLALIAIGFFFSPLLAVILLALALLAIGAVKYLGGSSVVDPESSPTATRGQADVPEPPKSPGREESKGGAWGETWPEEREGRS
jgi:hypothetical protein